MPALAYLKDHLVAGRPILPGAAMFETALAAARALQPDEVLQAGSSSSGSTGYAVIGASITAPVLLGGGTGGSGGGGGRGPLLQCCVNSASGSIELLQLPGVFSAQYSGAICSDI